jgi:saccharopine dehydrogenase-like NADP-dependent oxidoreductase
MSNFRSFAIIGAGNVGGFIVEELLKQKAAGAIDEITIVSRPVRHVPTHLIFTQVDS